MNKIIILFLFALIPFLIPQVDACSCVANMPIEQKVIGADIIFSGKLIEKYENLDYHGFIFEIDKLWKNHSDKILFEHKNITVFTPTQESACGTDFTLSLDYLVYSDMQGELSFTNMCSGSGLLFLKSSDVKHFEKNDIQSKEYYEQEHPLIPGSIAKMERDCRDGLLDKQNSPIRNGTHYYSNQTCEWLDLEELDNQSKSMGYEESENTKLARDRLNEADQTFGGPGPALYDGYSYFPMIFVAIGVVIFSLYIWKKRE